jgi:hypothetical protein
MGDRARPRETEARASRDFRRAKSVQVWVDALLRTLA